MLLEDDPFIAELVELVLSGTIAQAKVRHATGVAQAISAWHQQPAQLVICDQHLPDGSGLELVKLIRNHNKSVPIVMISAHSDRRSVISAAQQGISEFIAKPFDVNMLQQRLLPILQTVTTVNCDKALVSSLDTWLKTAFADQIRLPAELAPDAVLPLLAKSEQLSPQALTQQWQTEPLLSARLLKLANSASLKRSGKPVNRLDEAIAMLGVDMALRAAMALALDITGSLHNELLITQAKYHQGISEQIASTARAMATSLGLDGLSCYTAGLLSRAGEMAVLRTLQDFIALGGQLNESQVSLQLAQWAPQYGNKIKQQWGLPLPMRELIGAIHMPPTHITQRILLVMHLAALKVASQLDTPKALRMLRQSGLDQEKWLTSEPDATEVSVYTLTDTPASSSHTSGTNSVTQKP
nr:response regulator [Oceanisphaera pacifica]